MDSYCIKINTVIPCILKCSTFVFKFFKTFIDKTVAEFRNNKKKMMQEHISRIKIQVLKKIIYCIRGNYFETKMLIYFPSDSQTYF